MFKLLRKYNKLLLAVFGVLLMITFLIPQAIDNFSRQAGVGRGVVATVDNGQRISALEWDMYQRELRVLERMMGSLTLPGLGQIRTSAHWYLLVREAQQAGVVPVVNTLDVSSQEMRTLMNAVQEYDPQVITRAEAHLRGVAQLLSLYTTGDLFSDRRLRAEAERLLHSVNARMIVIQPDVDRSDFEPTEQQIIEHMNAFADKLEGEGDFGFGYKLPDRVKLEWLAIPASSIRQAIENSDAMDPVQQRLHWRRNASGTLPPYPTDGSAAAIPLTVRDNLLQQLSAGKSDEIAKFAGDTLGLALRGLPEREGYRVLPDDWATRVKPLPQLAEELRERYGIALPEYSARGDTWLTVDELDQLPGIGQASSDKLGATPVAFRDLVVAAKELGGHTTILVQKGVAGPAVKDAQGTLYFFRITDADASRPPASVDEVREQVVNDLKRKADYERVKASMTQIESSARMNGLLQAALENDTVVHAPTSVYLWNPFLVQIMAEYRMPMSEQPSELPVIGIDRNAVEAILDRALALPGDVPADQLSPEQRIFAVASDDRLAVLIVEVLAQRPLSQEMFNSLASMGALQQLVATNEAAEERSIERAFSYETLAKRNGFELKNVDEEEEDAADPAGDAEPTRSASVG